MASVQRNISIQSINFCCLPIVIDLFSYKKGAKLVVLNIELPAELVITRRSWEFSRKEADADGL